MRLWGIAPADPYDTVVNFAEQMGLTFPVLFDPDGLVHEQYSQVLAFDNTIFPQDWIVGVDGTIAYFHSAYDREAMSDVLDAELAKGDP